MCAAEIAHHVFLCVASFLVSNHHTALRAKHGQTARHGFVIGKTAVAVQLDPICKTAFEVIQSERPLHVPCNLNTLPGSQVPVNLASGFAKLCLNYFNRRIKIDIVLVGVSLEILQPTFQFEDRFFKIERL